MTVMGAEIRECQPPARASFDCEGAPKFDVVYASADGKVLDRHPACFRHGLAEVEWSAKAGSIATATLVEV